MTNMANLNSTTSLFMLLLLASSNLVITCQQALAKTFVTEFVGQGEVVILSQLDPRGHASGNSDRYVVYVESDSQYVLQQVRRVDSNAYIRPLGGRTVIQSGVFSESYYAAERVRDLELNGVSGIRVMVVSPPGQISSSVSTTTSNLGYDGGAATSSDNSANIDLTKQAHYYVESYYVVVPTSAENLRTIWQQIRHKVKGRVHVLMRSEPRGFHVALGKFKDRYQAEQWSNYLKRLGYGNARVYYGR